MSPVLFSAFLLIAPPPQTLPAEADPRGTELRRSAGAGDLDRVRRLLRAGVDPDAADRNGRTALVVAAVAGRAAVVRELLRAGADPGLRDREWGTALDAAARHGHRETVRLLRESGARGSGKSTGDAVCVRPWRGQGYCGRVEEVGEGQFRVRIEHLVGCSAGCEPSACSANRPAGGAASNALAVGDFIELRGECLTDTALRSWPKEPKP